jgi:hypothetical protein
MSKAESDRRYREKHKEKLKAYFKQWRLDNPDYGKEYRQKNKEKHNEYMKVYRAKHKKRLNAQKMQYKIDKRNQTPSWSDRELIDLIYSDCPDGYHVDHIEPIKGETVSGLHTAANLQYLTASQNKSKGNRRISGVYVYSKGPDGIARRALV